MNDHTDELMDKLIQQSSLEPVTLCGADGVEKTYKMVALIRIAQGNYVIMEPLDGAAEIADEKVVEIFEVDIQQGDLKGFALVEDPAIIDAVTEKYYSEYDELMKSLGLM